MIRRIIFWITLAAAIVIGIFIWYNQPTFSPKVETQAVEALEQFFISQMIGEDGGVKTTYLPQPYDEQATLTAGHATLSESQGLLLEYALGIDDQQLFLNTLAFITFYLKLPSGNFAWRIPADRSEKPGFTATIDDLQIIEQLDRARVQWPEIEAQFTPIIAEYGETFFETVTDNQFLIDGYNSEIDKKTGTLSISYLDFAALEAVKSEMDLDERIQIDEIIRQGRALIRQCFISEAFPFYYQRFFVKGFLIEKKTEINMIESMLVVKHLAEIDAVPEATIEWLYANIESGIFSYYNDEGEPITEEQSSAVYALVAQIAKLLEDEWLYEQAMAKIWQYQIQAENSVLNGALGDQTTQTVIAYDQLQTLIATIQPEE